MSRDDEAERYELQAERERHQELGRELYERRRPDAPKTWLELDEADRVEWILIAVDQERAGQASDPVTGAEEAALIRQETDHIEQLARWLHHHFDTEHLNWGQESEPGRDYYRKMARAQLSEVPFLAERLAKPRPEPVSTGDAALDSQIDHAAFEAGLQHLYEDAKAVIARTIGLARDIGYRQAGADAEDEAREREERADG